MVAHSPQLTRYSYNSPNHAAKVTYILSGQTYNLHKVFKIHRKTFHFTDWVFTFVHMSFECERISLANTGLLPPLVHDYLYQPEKISHLFSHSPKLQNVPQQIELKKQQPVNRSDLVEILLQQYSRRAPAAKTLENIQLLKHKNTFTICCAHQPTLFLYPAFYFYKIASTLSLAALLEAYYPEYRFVPIFWLGSEDHDKEELCNATLGEQPYQWDTPQKGAVGRFYLDASFHDLLNKASDNIQCLRWREIFHEAVKSTDNFGEFTAFVLQAIFGEHGLVVINQDDKKLKEIFSDIITEEIIHGVAEKILSDTNHFLNNHYNTQASVRPINFFLLDNQGRERILKSSDGRYTVMNRDICFTKEEIEKYIKEHPENFSPNVIYRPLFQETVLPNVAFVGGSAECSYWLQQKALFNHFKKIFPILVHRTPVVILPHHISKKISRLGLNKTALFLSEEQKIKQFIAENFGREYDLHDIASSVEKAFDEAEERITKVDITLRDTIRAEKHKALQALTGIEKKAAKALRKKNDTLINQLKAVHHNIFIDGVLQERKINFLNFMDGETLLRFLIKESNPLANELLLVHVQ
ncbi:MAG: bacillithiol biosynthesis cysteine-adding enzyme BshC [Chitinophagales bacterium]|nr:bacillithiol biosynthesis cysteine-adding enzyme BshC [Chitinophagales bacterium]